MFLLTKERDGLGGCHLAFGDPRSMCGAGSFIGMMGLDCLGRHLKKTVIACGDLKIHSGGFVRQRCAEIHCGFDCFEVIVVWNTVV